MSIFGGNAKDYPEPHKLKSESGEKREVTIHLLTYIGFSPGAVHYYAEVGEEDDMVWDEKENAWRKFWDHPKELKGRVFEKQFLNEANARSWIRMIVKDHFPDHDINVLYEGQHDWIYTREGD